jgi:Flp pilus assembly protein protease CpaA
MNITMNATLQVLAFSMATLLATGALVLAGLNERAHADTAMTAKGSLASISPSAKEPR